MGMWKEIVEQSHRLLADAGVSPEPNAALTARIARLVVERNGARNEAAAFRSTAASTAQLVGDAHRLLDTAAVPDTSGRLVHRIEQLVEQRDAARRAVEQRSDPTVEEAHRLLDSTDVETGTLAGRIEELMGRSDDAWAAIRETGEALDGAGLRFGSVRERVERLIESRRSVTLQLLEVEKARRRVDDRERELDVRERESEKRDAKWRRELDLRRDDLNRRESLLTAREAVVKAQLGDQGAAVRTAMQNGQSLPDVDDPATWPFPPALKSWASKSPTPITFESAEDLVPISRVQASLWRAVATTLEQLRAAAHAAADDPR